MVTGLARLKSVLDSLDDVLQLPQTQDSLQNDVVEKLLEDFLRFVDAYEVFHGVLLGLRQEVSSAQVAIRRKDNSKLGLYVKAHKKFANDVAKLVGTLTERSNEVVKPDDEIYIVVRDACRLTASISEAVFGGMSGSFGPGRRPIWAGLGLGIRKARKEEEGVGEFGKVVKGVESLLEFRKRKSNNNNNNDSNREEVKMGVLKGMQEMEECVGEMERESEKVFRSLISNRVSLLNILTHA
ncbi:uncharacterized protein LOC141587483 [Silene latifolia]|uniref:uncharacterized protein LOC141587483 n=1 Tax=Silene latifolia TaxID=37657 RepID=UPI003D772BEE